MHDIKKIIFAASAVFFIWSLNNAAAKVLPKTARIVPPETIVLVDIDNFSRTQQQFEKTNFYRLYKEPAMAAFFESVRTKLREKVSRLDGNNIFRTFFDTGLWPEGKTAAALLPNSKTKDMNDPGILFISQWGQNVGKIKDAIAKMLEKNTDLGGHKKANEDYRGVKIETLVDESSSAISYCFIDDCFLAASDAELLKFVIAHMQGVESPTLADDADYSAGFAATGPYHDVDIYVNVKQIIKITAAGDSTGQDRSMLASFGVDNVAGLSCSIGLTKRPASSCCGKMFLKINGAKKGICKILQMEAGAIKVPKFVPTSAYSVTVLNLDIKKAYDELYNMLYAIEPSEAAAISGPIPETGSQGAPDLQVKTDIIDHLGSQIVIAECLNKPFTKDSVPKETLLAVAVNNRTLLEKSLATLHSKFIAEGNPDARRELLGHTIYLLNLGRFFGSFSPGERAPMAEGPRRENLPQRPKFAFTVTDSHLIFGRENMVEGAIRTLRSSGAPSIESAKWFAAAKSSIPSVLGLASMEDNAADAELLWWLVKEKTKAKQLQTTISPNPQMMLANQASNMVDFTLLPSFDTVRKYFNIFGMYGLSRSDGFFIEFNYLNPPAAE